MKLNKVLCVFLMLAVVFSLASCNIISNIFGGNTPDEVVEYKVNFDTDGGSEVPAQLIEQGKTIAAPENPTKDGYDFIGWFYGEAEWDFSTPVNENMVLVAHWEETPAPCQHVDKDDDNKCDNCGEDFSDGDEAPVITIFTITYMDGDKKLNLKPNAYQPTSSGLVLPVAPAKNHYEFIGWFSDAALTIPATSIDVTAKVNLVFYAGYAPVSYRIDYQLDGGVNAESNTSVYNVESLPITLEAPTKEGFDFMGWYTDANCTEPITGITTSNIGNLTVYAKWEKERIPYTVTYLDKDGNELGSDVYYESNSDQPLRDGIELEGFVFFGWIDAETSAPYSCIPAGTAENLVLKANMKSNVSVRVLTYYINGEVYSSINFVIEDGVAELLAPSKAGYEFDGWYDNAECEGDKITSVLPGAEADVALYAKQTVITYTVKYFDGETELELAPSEYQISDSEIALPAVPAKDGYTIKGWYDAEGNKYTSIAANTVGDITLYATYEPKVYYITYYLNGGENNELNVTEYTYGSLPTLYNPLNRDGYTFEGWYTNANFTGYAVEDLSDCANCDVTLYAKWNYAAENGGSNFTPEAPF